jgi:hypothetical protein
MGMNDVYGIAFKAAASGTSDKFKYADKSNMGLFSVNGETHWVFQTPESSLTLNLSLPEDVSQNFISLEIILRRDTEDSNNETIVYVNDVKCNQTFDVCSTEFSDYYVSLPTNGFKPGRNTVKLEYKAKSGHLMYIKVH